MKFGFQMFIDEQQSLECPVHVAIASCDDFLDRNIGTFGSHTNPLHTHWMEYPSENGAEFCVGRDHLVAWRLFCTAGSRFQVVAKPSENLG